MSLNSFFLIDISGMEQMAGVSSQIYKKHAAEC